MSFIKSRNGIILYTVITAVIHLLLGISYRSDPDLAGLSVPFMLNFAGYLTLMYLYFWTPAALKNQKAMIGWVYLGFAVITIILYFVFNGAASVSFSENWLGMLTKLDELLLVIGLWQSRSK